MGDLRPIIPRRSRWGATVTLALLAMLAAGTTAAESWAAPTLSLNPGQVVRIRGTDVACAYGGPANHNGIECVHDSPAGARNSWTFRLEEDFLYVFHVVGGAQRASHSWRLAHTRDEPQSPAVNDATDLVGSLSVGRRFGAAETDLVCVVSRVGKVAGVTCAKRTSSGAVVPGSYEVVVTKALLRVQQLRTSGLATVFVARGGK